MTELNKSTESIGSFPSWISSKMCVKNIYRNIWKLPNKFVLYKKHIFSISQVSVITRKVFNVTYICILTSLSCPETLSEKKNRKFISSLSLYSSECLQVTRYYALARKLSISRNTKTLHESKSGQHSGGNPIVLLNFRPIFDLTNMCWRRVLIVQNILIRPKFVLVDEWTTETW
jgi:hypothetical protein